MLCDHPPVPIKTVAPHSAAPFAKLARPYAGVIAVVDAKGKVELAWLELSSGNKAYDKAAIAAMKLWTFVPAAANCVAMEGESEFVVGGNDYTFADPCNHDVIVTLRQEPQFSLRDTSANVPLTTEITVTVDNLGEVIKTSVKHASGSPDADAAVTRAALASNYFPAVHACTPQTSTYLFSGGITP